MDIVKCAAYGEIKNTSDYNKKEVNPDAVCGVYETIQ